MISDLVVQKFGGTSVADLRTSARLLEIVRNERRPRIVVVSAVAGVTDRLVQLGDILEAGGNDFRQVLDDLEARHLDMLAAISDPDHRDALSADLRGLLAQLDDTVSAAAAYGARVCPRTRDAIAAMGELLSSRIVAVALQDRGVPAAWVDARLVLTTSAEHGHASPAMDVTAINASGLLGPILAAGCVPVLGGFIGATVDGVTTTLGRGGSDYSAGIVGACLRAVEIQLWSDVDGMHTADPRLVPGTRTVPHMSFAVAQELARAGAKVLHPATIGPAHACDIPVRLLNSRHPGQAGTWVTSSPSATDGPVIALACRRSVCSDVRSRAPMAVVSIVGEQIGANAPVVTAALASLGGLDVTLLAQVSPRAVTVLVSDADLELAMSRLHTHFFDERRAASLEPTPVGEWAAPPFWGGAAADLSTS